MKISLVTLLLLSLAIQPTLAQDRAIRATAAVTVDPATENLINGALRWLASKQLPSGSWAEGSHQAAITAYVMMAFMSAGHLPGEGPYGKQMEAGLRFLLGCVRPDGYVAAATGDNNMYGHGIATIALGELYGQTQDENIRPKLQKAIDIILSSQNKEGGWRYQPRPSDADMSVTVLQVVALRVAINSGIDVPQENIDRAIKYVKSCQHEASGGFTYQPRRNEPGFARTAAAIYSLQVCGLYDDPMVQRGREYLEKNRNEKQWFTYGHFYAAPAMYMIGGDAWKDWYPSIRNQIAGKARQQGDLVSWDHIDGRKDGGQVYATAVYTTILAMPYHYIPLYQR
jgi:squalene cyclase